VVGVELGFLTAALASDRDLELSSEFSFAKDLPGSNLLRIALNLYLR